MKWTTLFVTAISSLLIALFAYTGMSKLTDYAVFKSQIQKSPYIYPVASFVAPATPIFELLLVFLLIFPKSRLAGLYLSYFVMLLFTGYVYIMLKFSPSLPCSCGGVISDMSWHQHLIFNAIFTILSTVGVFLEFKTTSPLTKIILQAGV
jgi:uncharacterized membrane protein YphA (DoxX/SURF4 family)